MTSLPEDTAKLKQLALKATPGRWAWNKDGHRLFADGGELIIDHNTYDGMWFVDEGKNKPFIAACSPETILKLIELVEGK